MAQEIVTHPEYALMISEIIKVRAAIKGQFFVKLLGRDLLPDPSTIKDGSPESKQAYNDYLLRAEYDEYPGQTMRSLVGRMQFKKADIELPDRLSYLLESIDGDGMSFKGAMSTSAEEIQQVNFHILVTDYQGLTDVNIEALSVQDVSQLAPRATIKSYDRESLINWHFERVGGVMQLVYVCLREVGTTFNPVSGLRSIIESFIILALDENGNYYQQKVTRGTDKVYRPSEISPVLVNGQPIKWLPVTIVSDTELAPGKLPLTMGFLSPVCDLALARYRISAEHRQILHHLVPTTFVYGWSVNSIELFQQANNRPNVVTGAGAVNFMPEGATVEIIGAEDRTLPFERDLESNKQRARELGAVIQGDVSNKTATEVSTTSAEQNARLLSLADSLEAGYQRAVLYCGMFEGLWSQDDIEKNMDAVKIVLYRDFSAVKLLADDVRVIIELVMSALITREQAIRQLAAGGWTIDDAETMLDEMDGGDINLTPND